MRIEGFCGVNYSQENILYQILGRLPIAIIGDVLTEDEKLIRISLVECVERSGLAGQELLQKLFVGPFIHLHSGRSPGYLSIAVDI